MAEFLAPHAKLPIVEAADRLEIENGKFYLCPPGKIPGFGGTCEWVSDGETAFKKPGQRKFDMVLLTKPVSPKNVCDVLETIVEMGSLPS